MLIIGAGAAGLMAGRLLALAGHTVHVLEASEHLGGRARSVPRADGRGVVELGAEYIHGRLPLTLALCAQAGLALAPAPFSEWEAGPNGLHPAEDTEDEHEEDDPIALVMNRLPLAGTEDMSFDAFLARYVAEPELTWTHEAARGYVQGFDAADTSLISIQAIRREWGADDEQQFRIVQGYSALWAWMAATPGLHIHLGHTVQHINWRKGHVAATGLQADGTPFSYQASAVVLTCSAGVWQREAGAPGYITLIPDLPNHRYAARRIGFGPAAKVVVEAASPFWQAPDAPGPTGFVFGGTPPWRVWWGDDAHGGPALTAWCGGPPALPLADKPAMDVQTAATTALAELLHKPRAEVLSQATATHYYDWTADPHIGGAYTYLLAGHGAAPANLSTPIEDTLFIAGEACYEGPHPGTVEAALATGQRAAEMMMP